LTPFRCIRLDETTLQVYFNHPLAQYALKLAAKVHEVQGSHEDRCGRCHDWAEIMTSNGIGFQSRYENRPTDFFLILLAEWIGVMIGNFTAHLAL
jgi:FKBP-type peptidyl-prolyl cis-trans isomerase 2